MSTDQSTESDALSLCYLIVRKSLGRVSAYRHLGTPLKNEWRGSVQDVRRTISHNVVSSLLF